LQKLQQRKITTIKISIKINFNTKNEKNENEEKKKNLASKKAISSEDFKDDKIDKTDSEIKKKLNNLKGSNAISSDDLFGNGEEEKPSSTTGIGTTLKDYALKFTLKAAEKAKEIKDKTKNLISHIQTKSLTASDIFDSDIFIYYG